MLLALSSLALATDRCDTPLALEVLRGDAEPSHAGMVLPPSGTGSSLPQPPDGRAFNGSPYELHRETEHFTINWFDAQLPEPAINLAAEALEQAWSAFVDEQGWPEPVSSQDYYLWVLLDPTLGETTGYTIEFFNDEFEQGYPVLYLNPDWVSQPAFYKALAAHEFMHAVQFGMREWQDEGPEQSWYWEASANHASELADPDWDGHQYTAAWYAEQAHLRFDSVEGSHHYGMFVLNAWLEAELGPGTMKGIWELSAQEAQLSTWDTLIEQSTDLPASEVWAGFSAAYANGALPESALYAELAPQGDYAAGVTGTLDTLGSHAWRVDEAGWIEVQGDAVLGTEDGQTGTTVHPDAGTILSVTGLSEGAAYTLTQGSPPDTGSEAVDPPGCGCTQVGDARSAWGLLLLGALLLRRRERRG